MGEELGYIHKTESFGAVDGPGIRYVFFLQGCPLRCLYCHNPDSTPCAGGTPWTPEQVLAEVLRYRSFIAGGGVTFSGGEPLLQAAFVRQATELLHEHGFHVAIDTAGCVPPGSPAVKEAIDAADLLLLDIKAAEPELALSLTGQDGQNALRTLEYCEATGKAVWVRHVLLAGYTLGEAQLEALADRLVGYTCIEKIELLPFHKLGEPKWVAMGREYLLADVPATNREQLEWAEEIFRHRGLPAG